MEQDFAAKNGTLPGLKAGKSRILVAPLDWGLGHTTRCIPIIRKLINDGNEVFLAGEGSQETILRTEFPDLPFLQLPGYRIRYGRTAAGLTLQMIRQVKKIRTSIKAENEWLQKNAEEYQFDAVVSDNRYGLYHEQLNCIFMTHQLHIKTGLGNWSERIIQNRNYHYINRFKCCWVPDQENANNLAGELSHPKKLPAVPVHYIGPVSRFKINNTEKTKDHLVILLSGPEPQRSILEEIMLPQLYDYNGTVTMVRGLPGSLTIIPSTEKLTIYNHLPASALNDELAKASLVIARSGYSTVMDLYCLNKKAILIPTPGQAEQQYLADYLSNKKLFTSVPQRSFSLERVLSFINFG
jgi:uncharacterized protein (TIGR00661 family)